MDDTILSSKKIKEIDEAIKIIETLTSKSQVFLTPHEKRKHCWINENNKSIIKKVVIYNKTNPELSSPDINWKSFDTSMRKAEYLSEILERIKVLNEGISGALLVQNRLNYMEALIDYNYTKYKAKSIKNDVDFHNKMEDISQHFSRKI